MYLHYEMHKRMKRRKNIPLQLALPHKHIYLLYKMISFDTKSQKQTKGFLVRKAKTKLFIKRIYSS